MFPWMAMVDLYERVVSADELTGYPHPEANIELVLVGMRWDSVPHQRRELRLRVTPAVRQRIATVDPRLLAEAVRQDGVRRERDQRVRAEGPDTGVLTRVLHHMRDLPTDG